MFISEENIKINFQNLYNSLNGSTSTSLYENYQNFFEYVKYFFEKNENIYDYIPNPYDQSVVNKHILASIRIKEFLSKCPEGAYLKLDVPITYWRILHHAEWNNFREILGMEEINSKEWKEQLKNI